MGHMSDSKEFLIEGEPKKYTVWTSPISGDLFRANRIVIDDHDVCFFIHYDLIKQYKLSHFVKNNPELFEGIQIKET